MAVVLRKVLIGFCVVYLLFGLLLISVAIWVIHDSFYLSKILSTELYIAASAVLLTGGVVVVATAVIGMVAISREISLLSKVFIIGLILLFLMLMTAGILAISFTGHLRDKIQNAMRLSLVQHYGNTGADAADTTQSWDKLQKDLRCCGVTGLDWVIYRNTSFFTNQEDSLDKARVKNHVPESCCVYNDVTNEYLNAQRCQTFQLGPPANPTANFRNDYLYYEGCYQAAMTFLLNYSWTLAALGFIVSVIMIPGFIMAVLHLRQDNRKRDKTDKADKTEKAGDTENTENTENI